MPPKKKAATASKAVDPEKLTVPKLKAELKKLGLETDGLKAVLVARLKERSPAAATLRRRRPSRRMCPSEGDIKSPARSPRQPSPPLRQARRGMRQGPRARAEPEPEPMQVDEPARPPKGER